MSLERVDSARAKPNPSVHMLGRDEDAPGDAARQVGLGRLVRRRSRAAAQSEGNRRSPAHGPSPRRGRPHPRSRRQLDSRSSSYDCGARHRERGVGVRVAPRVRVLRRLGRECHRDHSRRGHRIAPDGRGPSAHLGLTRRPSHRRVDRGAHRHRRGDRVADRSLERYSAGPGGSGRRPPPSEGGIDARFRPFSTAGSEHRTRSGKLGGSQTRQDAYIWTLGPAPRHHHLPLRRT